MNYWYNFSLMVARTILDEKIEENYYALDAVNGDPAPSNAIESTDIMMQALQKNLPGLGRVMGENILPFEQAKLAASEITSPRQAELQANLYDKYGQRLNDTGNQIARNNALAQAETDKQVLAGPGKELIASALEAQRVADPEYFKTRETMAPALEKLIGSYDLTGGLSAGENAAMERSVNQGNVARGTATAPSNIATVQNAVQFGDATRRRQQENQAGMANALNVGTGFLPASRTGFDPFRVATGKSSGANTGENKLTGPMQVGQDTMAMGNNMFNQIAATHNNAANINAQRRDGLDRFNETFSSTVGSVCCFIFMEAYNGNIPWYVRASRDAHKTPDMTRGYRIFGMFAIPQMKKHGIMRRLINATMINPLTKHAADFCLVPGSEGFMKKHWLCQKFWPNFWTLLGKYFPRSLSYGDNCTGIGFRIPFAPKWNIELWRLRPGTHVPPHSHEEFDSTLLTLSGTDGALFGYEDKTYNAKPIHLYSIPRGVRHSVTSNKTEKLWFINFQKWQTENITSASVDFKE
jgi:hypothetical protein